MVNIEENINLVYYCVNKYFYKIDCMERDDLIGYGMIGLTKAANRFDESLGIKFSTFAIRYIIGTIRSSLRDYSGKIGAKRGDLRYEAKMPIPFSTLEVTPLKEKIEPYEVQDDFDVETRLDNILISKALDILNSKERYVIESLFLQEVSQTKIAESLNCTQPTVSRIKEKALKKLRENLQGVAV